MEITTTLTTIAATITALGVIFAAARYIYKIAQRIEKAIGEDKEGRTLSDRLAKVERQVFANGGSSLLDKVNNLQKEVTEISAKSDIIENLLNAILEINATSNNNKRSGRSPRDKITAPTAQDK